jgi:hypothetical protein
VAQELPDGDGGRRVLVGEPNSGTVAPHRRVEVELVLVASCMSSVAVHTLVIDPTWKTESTVASTPVAVLSTPAATSITWPPAETAIAAPGTLCSASSAGRRS